MTTENFKRKLIAILSADVKGYSRLMEEDIEATVRTLTSYQEVITKVVQKHRGRVVDSPGDNILAEFASVIDAVSSAVEIQAELKVRNADLPENRKMEFRIGVNLGDVIHEEGRIYGDGVNVAARVESLADPGGICVSGTVFDQIESKLPLGYEFLGEQCVKNISKPVRIYKALMDPEEVGKVVGVKKAEPRRRQKTALVVVTVILLLVGGPLIWRTFFPPVQVAPVEKMPTSLYDAAMGGRKDVVELLLAKGVDVNTKDAMGRTSLYAAALGGHTDVAELLLSRGADINTRDYTGRTPLHAAVEKGHYDVAKLLISKNIDVDSKDAYGLTALHEAATLDMAELIWRSPVYSGIRTSDMKDAHGESLLHHAVRRGNNEIIWFLLGNNANINAKDNSNRTPLHLSVWEGNRETTEILLPPFNEADIEAKDFQGYTPMHYAVIRGNKELVEVLIAHGGDVNSASDDGTSPLFLAAAEGNKNIAEVLIDKGADLNAKSWRLGTPLHATAITGHKDVAELLIDKGADVNAGGISSETPLHLAAHYGQKEIAELLIGKGADVNARDYKGITPLKTAVDFRQEELAELLRKHGGK